MNNNPATMHLTQEVINEKRKIDSNFVKKRNKHIVKNNNGDLIGCILYSKTCGLFKILRKTKKKASGNRYFFKIKFIKTGYETKALYDNILKGEIKDLLCASIYGIACLGEDYKKYKKTYPELYKTLKDRYKGMISRCYVNTHHAYCNYGALRYKVSKDWLNFSNYFQDILDVINSTDNPEETMDDLISGDLEIDKDIKQRGIKEKVYSKGTISIVSRKENCQLDNQDNKKVIHFAYAYLNDDKPVWKSYNSVHKFAKEHNLCSQSIYPCLKCELSHAGDYIFRYLTDEEYELLKSHGFPDNYILDSS